MAEPDDCFDTPPGPEVPIKIRARAKVSQSPWFRGMACVAMLPLLGFIGQEGRTLWGEFRSLRRDQGSVRSSELVGYLNITPRPSYARWPSNWLHDEPDATMLWAGWIDNRHQWYRLGKGDVAPDRLSLPIGKDVIQAIDFPLFESTGGIRWEKVPDEAPVAGLVVSNKAIAIPLRVLDKVHLVNYRTVDRQILVAYSPVDETVSAFEAKLEEKRLTMGHAGYFLEQFPVFYDRSTESLWSTSGGPMVAIAGRRKGTTLARIEQVKVEPWSDWKTSHPDGQLLIGADRSIGRPIE